MMHSTVLGPTTLWLLVPVRLAIASKSKRKVGITLCALCCAVSVLHWRRPCKGSPLHMLDRTAAVINFCYLLITSNSILFPIGCLGFYAAAQKYDKCPIWHLGFRYVGYWWNTFVLTGRNRRPKLAEFVCNSTLYWTHAAMLPKTSYTVECVIVVAMSILTTRLNLKLYNHYNI